jgi:signal transduction histidine kinase
VAAHDLRSPLQAILDLIEWTIEDDETEVSEATSKNLRLIQSRASRLQMLLSDLLEYARAEDGTNFPEMLSPHNLILDVWDEIEGTKKFKLELDCHVDEVCTYQDPLKKIVQNLFENSIQHHVSEVGKIDVRVFERSNRLWMEITDDGPGIPPMYHKKIFELFQTLKARDVVEASGLGLAICMKIIKQFDGNLSLESDPEIKKGSTFIFDFPIEVIVPRRQAA